jgi:desulfoferrodoxin (superoxide reductase-like protein)
MRPTKYIYHADKHHILAVVFRDVMLVRMIDEKERAHWPPTEDRRLQDDRCVEWKVGDCAHCLHQDFQNFFVLFCQKTSAICYQKSSIIYQKNIRPDPQNTLKKPPCGFVFQKESILSKSCIKAANQPAKCTPKSHFFRKKHLPSCNPLIHLGAGMRPTKYIYHADKHHILAVVFRDVMLVRMIDEKEREHWPPTEDRRLQDDRCVEWKVGDCAHCLH